ncbi:hypothetical protein SY88_17600 [Clostridiales bacterium PH28_bin88]|nr:hypothetical protein SY88_17600 [Clostridiales bacterium PH28_bin88]
MTKGRMVYILFACWLTFFWIISYRAVYFTLVPLISLDLGLMPGQAGLLVDMLFFGYAVAVWLSSFIPARRKALVIGGLMLSLASQVAVMGITTFSMLLPITFLISFGGGLYLPRGVSLISDISNSRNRGKMIQYS